MSEESQELNSKRAFLEKPKENPKSRRYAALIIVGVLTACYSFAEIGLSIYIDSIALLSDGVHNLSDVISLVIAFWALMKSTGSRTDKMTYGWRRTEILGAVMNGCFLISLSSYILLECAQRIWKPSRISSDWWFIGTAATGILINTIGTLLFWLLSGGHGHSHAGGGHNHSHGGGDHNSHDSEDSDDDRYTPNLNSINQPRYTDEEEDPHHGHSHQHKKKDKQEPEVFIDNLEDSHGHGHGKEKKEKKNKEGEGHSHSHGQKKEKKEKEEEGHGHSHKKEKKEKEEGHGHSHKKEKEEGHGHSHKKEKKEKEEKEGDSQGHKKDKEKDHGHIHKKEKEEHGHLHETKGDYAIIDVEGKKKKEKKDFNIHAVFLHYLGDALSSVLVLTAGLLAKYFSDQDWTLYLDPISSLLIVILIMWTTIPMLRNCSKILLQQAPAGIEVPDLKNQLTQIDGIQGVHDVHIWQLVDDVTIASLHIDVYDADMIKLNQIFKKARKVFHKFGIHSTTLQPEFIYRSQTNAPCEQNCVKDCPEDWCCKTDKKKTDYVTFEQ